MRAKREYHFLISYYKNLEDKNGQKVGQELSKQIENVKKSKLLVLLDKIWRLKSQ